MAKSVRLLIIYYILVIVFIFFYECGFFGILQILKCLSEGNGIRATSRIVGVSKDTVGSIINRIGDHMGDVAATLMTDYHLEECQLDELWGYIFKKKGI